MARANPACSCSRNSSDGFLLSGKYGSTVWPFCLRTFSHSASLSSKADFGRRAFGPDFLRGAVPERCAAFLPEDRMKRSKAATSSRALAGGESSSSSAWLRDQERTGRDGSSTSKSRASPSKELACMQSSFLEGPSCMSSGDTSQHSSCSGKGSEKKPSLHPPGRRRALEAAAAG